MSVKIKKYLMVLLMIFTVALGGVMVSVAYSATQHSVSVQGYADYYTANGTENFPFTISDVADFNYYAGNNSDGAGGNGKNYFSSTSPRYYFKQTKDIVESEGNTFYTISALNGFYDGGGKTITKIGHPYLFDQVNANSKVSNLKIHNNTHMPTLDYSDNYNCYWGGLVGFLYGTLENCSNLGNSEAGKTEILNPFTYIESWTTYYYNIGGLVARSYSGAVIIGCKNFSEIALSETVNMLDTQYGYVFFRARIGGVVGYSQETTISQSYNLGELSVKYVKSHYSYEGDVSACIGGIVGESSNGNTISECFNGGYLYSNIYWEGIEYGGLYAYIGGIIGRDYFSTSGKTTTIENCYNVGTIITESEYTGFSSSIGGIFGYIYSPYSSSTIVKFSQSYNMGKLKGTNIGHIGGLLSHSTPANIYFHNNYGFPSNITAVGSNSSFNSSVMNNGTNSVDVTLENLKDQSNYPTTTGSYDWDFFHPTTNPNGIWVTDVNYNLGLPFFNYMYSSIESIPQGNVVFYANGGIGSMATQSFKKGFLFQLNTNTFTRENYTYAGWSATSEGKMEYLDKEVVCFGKDITFYAVWLEGDVLGSGTQEDPYIIDSIETWNGLLVNFADKDGIYYKQTADLIETAENKITNLPLFAGVYDGNGKKISLISGYAPFIEIESFGYVSNLTVSNSQILGYLWALEYGYNYVFYSGGICVYLRGTLDNCSFVAPLGNTTTSLNDILSGYSPYEGNLYFGGIVGYTGTSSKIINCTNYSDFYMSYFGSPYYFSYHIGGIVGYNRAAVSDSNNIGNINVEMIDRGFDHNYVYIGGIAGYSYNNSILASIVNCKNSGNIRLSLDGASFYDLYIYIGGVCGSISGSIKSSFNTGKMNIEIKSINSSYTTPYYISTNAGGLSGSISGVVGFSIEECFNSGEISVEDSSGYYINNLRIGGLLGSKSTSNAMNIRNCYNTGKVNVSGGFSSCYVGGFMGYFSVYYSSTPSTNDNYLFKIYNSYNIGQVQNTGNYGLLIGYISNTTDNYVNNLFFYNTYAAVDTPTGSANIIGNAYRATIDNACKNMTNNLGQTVSVTLQNLKDKNNYPTTTDNYDWDFYTAASNETGVWDVDSSINDGFPYLKQIEYGEYTLTYHANGGSGTMTPQVVRGWLNFQLKPNLYTKTNTLFLGWSLIPDGEVRYREGNIITLGADLTIYAVWLEMEGVVGKGTESDPIQIASESDWNYILDVLEEVSGVYYKQVADITESSLGSMYRPINFSGNYNGNGKVLNMIKAAPFYKISAMGVVRNLSVSNRQSEVINRVALGYNYEYYFAGLVEILNGEIEGCSFINYNEESTLVKHPYIYFYTESTHNFFIGGLVGKAEGGATIKNCSNYSDLAFQFESFSGEYYFYRYFYVGGIVGSSNTNIENCYNYGEIATITHTSHTLMEAYVYVYLGGIAGKSNSSIMDCANYGELFADRIDTMYTEAFHYLGGIVGHTNYIVEKCINIGNIHYNSYEATGYSYTNYYSYFGGIVGYALGTNVLIHSCINTGDLIFLNNNAIYVNRYWGGIVGYFSGVIQRCVNGGDITSVGIPMQSGYLGGLVGYGGSSSKTLSDSYNSGSIMGGSYVGGFIGYNYQSSTSYSTTLNNCYNVGDLYGSSATTTGLFIGYNPSSSTYYNYTVSNGSYSATDIGTNAVRTIGYISDVSAPSNTTFNKMQGDNLATKELLKSSSNFAGSWDFYSVGNPTGIWKIDSYNLGFPYLKNVSNENITISYDGNGEAGSMSSQAVPTGTMVQLSENGFSSSYIFFGWEDANKSYNNMYEEGDIKTFGVSSTLKATWIEGLAGGGTEENPFLIYNIYQWNNYFTLFSSKENFYYKQMANLDYTTEENIISISSFAGNYDGNGYYIRHIGKSLFLAIAATGEVKNLIVYNDNPEMSNDHFGGICLYLYGTITGCVFKGKYDGTIINNTYTSNGSYEAYWYIGGIASRAYAGSTISFSRNEADFDLTLYYNDYHSSWNFGGIVGYGNNTTIFECINLGMIKVGDVEEERNGGYSENVYFGGIAGYLYNNSATTLYNSYNAGLIEYYTSGGSYNSNVGGLVGCAYITNIENSFNSGKVKGHYSLVGGLIALLYASENISFTNCYNVGEIFSPTGGSYSSAGLVAFVNNYTLSFVNCYNIGKADYAFVSSYYSNYWGNTSATFNISNSYASPMGESYSDFHGDLSVTGTNPRVMQGGVVTTLANLKIASNYHSSWNFGGGDWNTLSAYYNAGFPYLSLDYAEASVTFYKNDGGDDTYTQIGSSGLLSYLEDTGFIRGGHTFLGWSTASDSLMVEFSPLSPFVLNGNKNLYAVWLVGTIEGSGTQENPYIINSIQKWNILLMSMGTTSGIYFKQTVSLIETTEGEIQRIPMFNANYNGDDNSIKLLSGTAPFQKSTGDISNLNVYNQNVAHLVISSANYIGGVVVYATGGSITNCTFYGIEGGETYNLTYSTTMYIGGIVGYNAGALISQCVNYSSFKVNNSSPIYIGGIVSSNSGNIENCTNNGSLETLGNGSKYQGGILGHATSSFTLKNVFNYGNITAATSYTNTTYVGGLMGHSSSTVEVLDGYNEGDVEATCNGTIYSGGIAGYSYNNRINKGYNKGFINANYTTTGSYSVYVGGIAGYSYTNIISDFYNLGEIYGTSYYSVYSGGLIGRVNGTTSTTNSITRSYNYGDVTGIARYSSSYYAWVGGLIGYCGRMTITNSFNTGNIHAELKRSTPSISYFGASGGLIGYAYTYNSTSYKVTIQSSYSLGKITVYRSGSNPGNEYAGGLIGKAYSSSSSYLSISSTFNANDVNSTMNYSIAGTYRSTTNSRGTTSNSYADTFDNIWYSYFFVAGTANIVEVWNTAAGSTVWEWDFLTEKPVLAWEDFTPIPTPDGTEENPYLLYTAMDFVYYSQNGYFSEVGNFFLQVQDIVVPTSTTIPQSVLNSTYNGDGYSLSFVSSHPIFSSVGSSGTIKNLTLSNTTPKVSPANARRYSALVDTLAGGTLENIDLVSSFAITYTATSTHYIGGLVAYAMGGNIINCTADVVMAVSNSYNSTLYMGGLVGYVSSANLNIIDCKIAGDIVVNPSADMTSYNLYLGGMIGYCNTAYTTNLVKIENSSNKANITINKITIARVGGLIGYAYCSASSGNADLSIINCYNSGNISIDQAHSIGGLIGYLSNTNGAKNYKIEKSFNLGNMQNSTTYSGGYAGGLIGYIYAKVTLENCFNGGDIVGYNVGGFAGYTENGSTRVVTFAYCYNIGVVVGNANYRGCFVGRSSNTANYITFTNSYFVNDVVGNEANRAIGNSATLNANSISLNNIRNPQTHLTGWDFTTVWESTPTINAGIPLIRGATYKQITLNFNGNGATSGSMDSIITYASLYTVVPSSTFIRTDYTFLGWARSSQGDVEFYEDGLLKIDDTYTLYAKWLQGTRSGDSYIDAILISSVADWNNTIASIDTKGKHFMLTNNISETPSSKMIRVENFGGGLLNQEAYFHGEGYSITLLSGTAPFYSVNQALIRDLTVYNNAPETTLIYVNSGYTELAFGGIVTIVKSDGVASGLGTQINNCVYKGSTTNNNSLLDLFHYGEIVYVGGIVGYLQNSVEIRMDNCVNESNILVRNYIGHVYIGGVVGYFFSISSEQTIQNFTNKGDITAIASSMRTFSVDYDTYVGGIIGVAESVASVSAFYNLGNISVTLNNYTEKSYVGGLVGFVITSQGFIISASFNSGVISSNALESSAGGLVGALQMSVGYVAITDSYNIGNVSAATSGGAIGFVSLVPAIVEVRNFYNTGEIYAASGYSGYILGNKNNSSKSLVAISSYSTPSTTGFGNASKAWGFVPNSTETASTFSIKTLENLVSQSLYSSWGDYWTFESPTYNLGLPILKFYNFYTVSATRHSNTQPVQTINSTIYAGFLNRIPTNTFSNAGFDLYGWNKDNETTVIDYIPEGTYTAGKEITIYAVWVESGGQGLSIDNPFFIGSVNDWNYYMGTYGDNPSYYYQLITNISEASGTPILNVPLFAGTLYGDFYKITLLEGYAPFIKVTGQVNAVDVYNYFMKPYQNNYGGIAIYLSGEIKDCNFYGNEGEVVISMYDWGQRNIGGIAAVVQGSALIERVSNLGNFRLRDFSADPSDAGWAYMGGLVGRVDGSILIMEAHNFGILKSENASVSLGGLVGFADIGSSLNITSAHNLGDINVSNILVGGTRVGGIIGQSSSDIYINISSNLGNIDIYKNLSGAYAGGLIGECNYDKALIERSFNTGDIIVDNINEFSYAGGILGNSEDCKVFITESFNAGRVEAGYAGGMVGLGNALMLYTDYSSTYIIQNCYNVGEIFGLMYAGGVYGRGPTTGRVAYFYNKGFISAPVAGFVSGYSGSTGQSNITSFMYFAECMPAAKPYFTYGNYNVLDGAKVMEIANPTSSASYIGFNFSSIWNINVSNNYGYPYLDNIIPYWDSGVSFNANGGSGYMGSKYGRLGEYLTIPTNAFTRPGYTFIGWSESPSGEVIALNNGEYLCKKFGLYELYAIWYSGTVVGSGQLNDPYQINSVEVWNSVFAPLAKFNNLYFKQTANLDNSTATPVAYIQDFRATYEGDSFYINKATGEPLFGIFHGYLNNSKIYNTNLKDQYSSTLYTYKLYAGVATEFRGGKLYNSSFMGGKADGSTTVIAATGGDYTSLAIGGFFAIAYSGDISNSSNQANIILQAEGVKNVGAFAGYLGHANISDSVYMSIYIYQSYNIGDITILSVSENSYIGGFIGNTVRLINASIIKCYNYGDVKYPSIATGQYAGGFIGYSRGIIVEDCFNMGEMYAYYAGGFLGYYYYYSPVFASFYNVYNGGKITGTSATYSGYLIGYTVSASGFSFTNCFGVNDVGSIATGAIGNRSTSGCSYVTSAHLQVQSNIPWDFTDIWQMAVGINDGFPVLKELNEESVLYYNGNGNTGGTMTSQTVYLGLPITLNNNTYTKTNFTYLGWSTSIGGDVKYANGSRIFVTQPTTLYAFWILGANKGQSEGNPFEIYSATDWNNVVPIFDGETGYYYILRSDISEEERNIYRPQNFNSSYLDGDGYSIYLNSGDGLINEMTGGVVKNLTVFNDGYFFVTNSTLKYKGGIINVAQGGAVIHDCNFGGRTDSGVIETAGRVYWGGIVGYAVGDCTIYNSASFANIHHRTNGDSAFGGIVGAVGGTSSAAAVNFQVYNSFSIGDVVTSTTYMRYYGGIVGLMNYVNTVSSGYTIYNCYSMGHFRGYYSGGIVGGIYYANSDSYSVSMARCLVLGRQSGYYGIMGGYTGYIVGYTPSTSYNAYFTMTDCYAASDVPGNEATRAIGYNQTSKTCNYKTMEELKSTSVYVSSWDFTNEWYSSSSINSGFPILRAITYKPITISYNSNGGTGNMSDMTSYAGTFAQLPPNNFTKAENSFGGWSTSPDGEIFANNNETVSLSKDTTLYAKWLVQGSFANPFIINNSADWNNYLFAYSGVEEMYFKLGKDLAVDSSYNIIEDFRGVLLGNNKNIYNNINKPLFLNVYGKIQDLTIYASSIISQTYIKESLLYRGGSALIFLLQDGGIIENIVFKGDVVSGNTVVTESASSHFIGGLVAYSLSKNNNFVNIIKCGNEANITGGNSIGGLVGFADELDFYSGLSTVVMEDSYNTGNISATFMAGGLVARGIARISRCFNTGNIEGNQSVLNEIGIGGLVGYAPENRDWGHYIDNSYNTGEVSGSKAGGLIGGFATNSWSSVYKGVTISYSYNIGKIKSNGSSNAGHFIGSSMSNAYSYMTSIYNYVANDIPGNMATEFINGGSVSVNKRSLAELKNETYSNWNFTTTWEKSADLNNGLPLLRFIYSTTQHTIHFIGNGGSGSMSNIITYSGVSVKVPQNTFTKTGYGFFGWSLSSSGFIVVIDQGFVSLNRTTNLYAVWKEGMATGTEEDPFLIHNINDWNDYISIYGEIPGYHYKLVGSMIELEVGHIVHSVLFSGTLDGNGMSIVLLSGYAPFQVVRGTIKNLTVYNNSLKVYATYLAGIVMILDGGIIDNCTFGGAYGTGSVPPLDMPGSSYVGGIVAYSMGSSQILNCTNNATFNTLTQTGHGSEMGGILGSMELNSNVRIENCRNTGDIDGGTTSHNKYVGGIVGYIRTNVQIIKSSNTGKLQGGGSSYTTIAGGIAGYVNLSSSYSFEVTIEDCYNLGTVETVSSGYSAGLVGILYLYANNKIYIKNSYSAAIIKSNTITSRGLLLASINNDAGILPEDRCIITNSFAATGFPGNAVDAVGRTQRETSFDFNQFRVSSSFLKNQANLDDIWNFSTIWGINSNRNNGFPYIMGQAI